MKSPLLARLQRPFAFSFYQFWKLPSTWFWGLRITEADGERCSIGLPFRWTTQNPFRSIYFGALLGAGEMSTGLLALAAIDGAGGPSKVSMLVVEARAEFLKKAAGYTVFTCEEGARARAAIQKAVETGEGQTLTMVSEGRLRETGEPVCRVHLTWSFKKKKG